MAASVRIEDEAFSDVRYDVLAVTCALADADHALGKMARLWRQCTAMHSYVLPVSVVCAVLGPNGASALVESRLGEAVDGGIRIRGTRGRIEWLKKLRQNAKKGGTALAAKRQPNGSPIGKQKGAKSVPPPSPPAPAPAPAQEEDQSVSGKPDQPPLDLFKQKVDATALEHNARHAYPRDPARDLAAVAVAEINRLTGKKYRADSDAVLSLCRALSKAKRTPEQVRAVVQAKREWIGDAKMDKFFRPATLLAASNFANYLDEIEAKGAGAPPAAQPSTTYRTVQREEIVHPLMALIRPEEPDAA